MNIVKCRFLKDGEPSGREYSYLANEELAVGDTVIAVTDRGEADLVVTQLNIPESEVEAFKDRLKTVRKAEITEKEVKSTENEVASTEKETEIIDLGF